MDQLCLRSLLVVAALATAAHAGPLEDIIQALENRQLNDAVQILNSMNQPFSNADRARLIDSMKRLSPQGDWIPFLHQLARLHPADPELLFFSAQAAWRAGDVDSAIELSGKAIGAASPSDSNLIYRCAAIARTSGRNDVAKERIKKVLALNGDDPDGLFLLGSVEFEEGRLDDARIHLAKVVERYPNHFRAQYELGRLEARADNSEQAMQHLTAAVQVYPFFREAYAAMRTPLSRLKREAELNKIQAIVDYTQHWNPDKYARLRHSFENPFGISQEESAEMAVELSAMGREDMALAYLENLYKRSAIEDRLKLMLAQLRFNRTKYAECLAVLDTMDESAQQNSDTFYGLKAWALLRAGKKDESRALYDRFADRFKESRHFAALAKAFVESETAPAASTPPRDIVSATAPIIFADCTERASLAGFRHVLGNRDKRWIIDAMGSGVAVADYDNDGDDDIYFVNGRPDVHQADPQWRNALFRNDGGVFTDVTLDAGVGDMGFGMCAAFGDVNNDGWLDLFVGNYGPNVFYRNNGDGTFTEATQAAGLEHQGYAAAACFGDVDRDGDLDLFVGNYVQFDPDKDGKDRAKYHGKDVMMGPLAFPHQPDCLFINDGTGTFADKAGTAGINVSPGRAMGASFFDIDNDSILDLYVANDSTYNHVLRGRGDGTFEDLSFISGGGFSDGGRDGASMGVSVGDFDNNQFMDILVTSYEQESDVIFQNTGKNELIDMSGPFGLLSKTRWLVTWGSGFCDFDADGLLDYYTVNGHVYPQVEELDLGRTYPQGASIYRNKGKGFDDVSAVALPPELKKWSGRGSALLDFDCDGDMDIVINCMDSSPRLLENRSRHGSWLQVTLEGTSSQTFGVRIVARQGDTRWTRAVDGGSGYLSQNSQTVHFGFGDRAAIDDLTVYWFHRDLQVISSPELNQRLTFKATE